MRNGKQADFVLGTGGVVRAVLNAQLGDNWLAPIEGPAWNVGVGCAYTNIEAAVSAIYSARGTNVFTSAAVVLVNTANYTNDVNISTNLGRLNPTTNFPLIVRSAQGLKATIGGSVNLTGIPNVRFQGFYFTNTATAGVITFTNAVGASIASCVVRANMLVSNCFTSRVVGCTFDYQSGTRFLSITNCTNVLVRDNIYLNSGTNAAVVIGGPGTTNSQFNCYFPSNSFVRTNETNSIYVDPWINTNGDYEIVSFGSPVRNSGQAVFKYDADVLGQYRSTVPCRGAKEYLYETNTIDAAGRIASRIMGGRTNTFAYNAMGQLTAFTNRSDSTKNATYTYDCFARRVRSVVGSTNVTRYVYQGQM